MKIIEKIYLNDREASIRYGYSRAWFQRSRWDGSGPKYFKMKGKVLYPIKETDKWFKKHLRNPAKEQ